LALTGNVTQMNVGWYTQDKTAESILQWGFTPNLPFPMSVAGNTNQWMSGYGYNHFAVATGLMPATTYYYRCGDPKGGWSNITSFTTAPATSGPFTLAV